ncbi:ribosome maturation sbds [Trichoderma arundinaceum]|uniref:Ribosome maturation sbds n=1 Tax=Trichoderma arundinaceum TaxID=490622 RepID=A0A395N838_TRIAR|nr:ribosome maturation sbds [Trichoderma arundinaceum]
MTRGESTQSKIHYKGKQEDFLVFVDDVELYKKWLSDKSVPLAHFTSAFTVFVTHRQGTQGTYDAASKMELSAEFDTDNTDDVIVRILEEGTLQYMEMPGRQGPTNESMSSMRVK